MGATIGVDRRLAVGICVICVCRTWWRCAGSRNQVGRCSEDGCDPSPCRWVGQNRDVVEAGIRLGATAAGVGHGWVRPVSSPL